MAFIENILDRMSDCHQNVLDGDKYILTGYQQNGLD